MRYVSTPFPLTAGISPGQLNGLFSQVAGTTRNWTGVEQGFRTGQGMLPSPSVTASELELLLCAGLALGPASTPSDPAAWYAVLRHATTLTSDGTLRVQNWVSRRDTRIRGVWAEELALGIGYWLLFNQYGVAHIADAEPFLRKAASGGPFSLKTLRSMGIRQNGVGYKPDLLCVTPAGQVVIAESKGTMGKRSTLSKPLKKGQKQVGEVKPTGCTLRPQAGRLVFATCFPIEGMNTGTQPTTMIADVKPEDTTLQVEVTADQIVRRSLGNSLRLAGLAEEAGAVEMPGAQGQQLLTRDRFRLADVEHHPVRLLSEFTGGWWFALADEVWSAVVDAQARALAPEHIRHAALNRTVRSERVCLLPNGFGLVRLA